MTTIFYRRDGAAPLPEDGPRRRYQAHWWRPASDGPPRGIFASPVNRMWHLLDRVGAMASHDLAALAITDGGATVHRLLVTPRWYRFPDMGSRDLQIGMVWTHPERRGEGLAMLGMQLALAIYQGRYEAMWYLVDAENASSIRLAEKQDFMLVGTGRRTAPLGLAPLGRFRIETKVS